MKNSKGFTIIELLVVVAIIAVLAAIVLVNVTSYINKGKDAAIQGNMSSMLVNGAVYFDNNGNYTSFLTSAGYTAPADAAKTANGGTVLTGVATSTAWCSCSPLKTSGTFCVDSTGTKKTTATACATECPATAACI